MTTPKIGPPINTSRAEFTVRKPRIFTAAPTDYKGNRKSNSAKEPRLEAILEREQCG